jgi:plasmid maintenance system killer protein
MRQIRPQKAVSFFYKIPNLTPPKQRPFILRLNDQWRLIVQVKPAEPKNIIFVEGIEDYH